MYQKLNKQQYPPFMRKTEKKSIPSMKPTKRFSNLSINFDKQFQDGFTSLEFRRLKWVNFVMRVFALIIRKTLLGCLWAIIERKGNIR